MLGGHINELEGGRRDLSELEIQKRSLLFSDQSPKGFS